MKMCLIRKALRDSFEQDSARLCRQVVPLVAPSRQFCIFYELFHFCKGLVGQNLEDCYN